jgi:hypothetical protein
MEKADKEMMVVSMVLPVCVQGVVLSCRRLLLLVFLLKLQMLLLLFE